MRISFRRPIPKDALARRVIERAEAMDAPRPPLVAVDETAPPFERSALAARQAAGAEAPEAARPWIDMGKISGSRVPPTRAYFRKRGDDEED